MATTEPDLNLKEEFKKVEQAHQRSSCYPNVKGKVVIKQLSLCRWAEVMEKIREEKPTVLHVSSHSTRRGG